MADQANTQNQATDQAAKQDNGWIDANNLPVAQLKALGFHQWNKPDANGNVLMLVPTRIFSRLKAGTVLQSIKGTQVTVGKDKIGTNQRFGMMGYGVIVKA